jgi:hypothetical protein
MDIVTETLRGMNRRSVLTLSLAAAVGTAAGCAKKSGNTTIRLGDILAGDNPEIAAEKSSATSSSRSPAASTRSRSSRTARSATPTG